MPAWLRILAAGSQLAAAAAVWAALAAPAQEPSPPIAAHWSHAAPVATPPPQAPGDGRWRRWPRTGLDAFLLAKMAEAKVSPSPEADREALFRRLTLQLTGLPPTLEEIDAFLGDGSPDAYEKAVDRLLASPRFGERLALPWLDLARYADTHGYHADTAREMWRYRDWVIEALNANMPFDQFTIEQLAGDLLPASGEDDDSRLLSRRIATGFHRNHMINFENGIFPEEYRTEYVHDRVATTATVFMGQTLLCARCHDHKYEPFTQRDYYRLFAYFNNVPENGVDGRDGNAKPFIAAPTRLQQEESKKLTSLLASLDEQLRRRAVAAQADQANWEAALVSQATSSAPPGDASIAFTFDDGQAPAATRAGEARVVGQELAVEGKIGGGLLFDGQTYLEGADLGPPAGDAAFSLAAWVFPTTSDEMTLLQVAGKVGETIAWRLVDGRMRLRLHSPQGETLESECDSPLGTNKWRHLVAVFDPQSSSSPLRLYVDGKACPVQQISNRSEEPSGQTAASGSEPAVAAPAPAPGTLRIGEGFRGLLDEVCVFARPLGDVEVGLLFGEDRLKTLVSIPVPKRTAEQTDWVSRYYLERVDEPYRRLLETRRETEQTLNDLQRRFPTAMVMEEMPAGRRTHLLIGGDYRSPGEALSPGVPQWLLPLPAGAPENRLGLAMWLTDPQHPLTARVAVNRYWQLFFGVGLAPTSEDLGLRGDPPTHPELLDYLAVRFLGSGWDVKRLVRDIVTSAAYRQASRQREETVSNDPDNRLLARFPRQRLEAELIRDLALASAGMLDSRIGGPSVFPYQPPGIWEELSVHPTDYSAQVYKQSHGADLYRRSLYTFWKRSAPPPALAALDAPDREVCLARRQRSNTPLQALVLMNDPVLVEAARALAERVMSERQTPENRIGRAFRLAASRWPTAEEQKILVDLYLAQLQEYRQAPAEAEAMLQVGQWPVARGMDRCELAAMAMVASAVLSLDESISVP